MTIGDALGEIALAKEKLLELKTDLAVLWMRLALKRFDPQQPRWPAGTTIGGQWRPTGGTTGDEAVGYDPSRRMECEAQRMLDQELCRMARSATCWEVSDERYNNCMRGAYIPPLRF